MLTPTRVVIAGGGVAGLEALFALHAMAGDHVELTLVSPGPDFVYRPLAVAEPFALGAPRRTPLSEAVAEVGATLVSGSVQGVDSVKRRVTLEDDQVLDYDALVLALGAASEPSMEGALMWDDSASADAISGIVRDLEEGYSHCAAIVIPPGPGWPLPAYELALLISEDARGMDMSPEIVLVTPEQAPLAIFGSRATAVVREELETAGIRIELASYADAITAPHRALVLRPSMQRIEVDRLVALPRLRGRAPDGIPHNADGFISVDPHCRVIGLDHVWAAGDGIDFPVKFGGLATQQADTAAIDIAHLAGASVTPKPFRPVLRGKLLTGRHRDRYLRYDAGGGAGDGEATPNALWWPPGKISGRWLSPWLAARDDAVSTGRLPKAGGLQVETDLQRNYISFV